MHVRLGNFAPYAFSAWPIVILLILSLIEFFFLMEAKIEKRHVKKIKETRNENK